MNFWERIKSALRREAADVKEGMSHVGRTLNEELERKERELKATPGERFDMILEDIEQSDARIGELESTLQDRPAAGPKQRTQPAHQLLEAAEVSSSPRLGAALERVRVEFEPLETSDHTHVVQVDSAPAPIDSQRIADAVGAHTLVASSSSMPDGTIRVRADHLHVEDVRLLAAAALAEQTAGG